MTRRTVAHTEIPTCAKIKIKRKGTNRNAVFIVNPKIKQITENKVEKVVVLYKDRLLRFGFELVEYLAELYHCEIEVIDHTEKTEQQELVEDLVQIITVFSCKLQGKRANKAKKMIQELKCDDKDISSNVVAK